MSDETDVMEAIAASPVSRPDVPEVTAKPKGRPKLPRDANGNIIRADGTVSTPQARRAPKTDSVVKSKPETAALTDESIGKAIGGAFSLVSIALGPHWKLFTPEEKEWGEAIGPLARIYGTEKLAQFITALMLAPLAVNTVMPRLAVEQAFRKGEFEKHELRGAILKFKAFMAAENELNIEQQVTESKAYLKEMVAKATVVAATAKVEEMKQEAVYAGNGVND